MDMVLRGPSKCGSNKLCLGKDGCVLDQEETQQYGKYALAIWCLYQPHGWVLANEDGEHEKEIVRKKKNNKSIFILTSLRGNRQWLFCWGPRPCRGIEQCRRWYFSASHSQSGTGSPRKETGPRVTSCLREHVGQSTFLRNHNSHFHLPFWGPCWISFGPWPPVYSSAYFSWNTNAWQNQTLT